MKQSENNGHRKKLNINWQLKKLMKRRNKMKRNIKRK